MAICQPRYQLCLGGNISLACGEDVRQGSHEGAEKPGRSEINHIGDIKDTRILMFRLFQLASFLTLES